MDFLDQRLAADAQGARRFALPDQQTAAGDFLEAFKRIEAVHHGLRWGRRDRVTDAITE
jgi:hypothetical protein